jgi:hypothetical protein
MPRGRFKTPCMVCGVLSDGGSRCATHQAIFEANKRARLDTLHAVSDKRDKYKGDYAKRAREVKQYALENNLPCPLCGQSLLTGGGIHADHIDPKLGNDSPLQAVHASCNLKKSNRSV